MQERPRIGTQAHVEFESTLSRGRYTEARVCLPTMLIHQSAQGADPSSRGGRWKTIVVVAGGARSGVPPEVKTTPSG